MFFKPFEQYISEIRTNLGIIMKNIELQDSNHFVADIPYSLDLYAGEICPCSLAPTDQN